MLKAGALILVAALAASAPNLQTTPSQHPPISPAGSGNKSASPENRGTDDKPLVVKIRTTPEGDKEAADEAKAANDQAPNDRLLIKLTGALALAAFFQWGVMLWQAILARQQISLSRQEFVASRRAWMAVPEPRLDGVIAEGHRIVIEMLIYNRGNTPATGVNHYGIAMMPEIPENISYAPDLWSPGFAEIVRLSRDLAVPVKGRATVFPGQYISVPLRFPAGNFLPGAEVKDLVEGKKFLVMYGCVGYFTLDAAHYTPYCLYLIRDDALPGKYRFGVAPIGNEAD
jgi:hypothetical protein